MARFLNDKDNVTINSPHCSVLVYNYLARTLNFNENQWGSGQQDTRVSDSEISAPDAFSKIVSHIDSDVEIIKLDSHIINVVTRKSKYNHAGSFQITLSPAINWMHRLTMGSWVVVMMSSNTDIMQKDYKYANPQLFKFVGQIRSISQNVSYGKSRVDSYVVSGSDWGEVFNDVNYYSEFLKTEGIQNNIAYYNLFSENVIDVFNAGDISSTSSNQNPMINKTLNVHNQIYNFVKKAWAMSNSQLNNILMESESTLNSQSGSNKLTGALVKETSIKPETLIHPFYTFCIPRDLRVFLRLPVELANVSFPMINYYIKIKAFETPSKELEHFEAYRIPDLGDLSSSKTIWAILNAITEPAFFELYPEISWKEVKNNELKGLGKKGGGFGSLVSDVEQYGNPLKDLKDLVNKTQNKVFIPQFCLYHRPKPFTITNLFSDTDVRTEADRSISNNLLKNPPKNMKASGNALGGYSFAKDLAHHFVDLKSVVIDETDIISIDAGYDWDSKYNFVEMTNIYADQICLSGPLRYFSQTFDRTSFLREGFRPFMVRSALIPFDPNKFINETKKTLADAASKKTTDASNKQNKTDLLKDKTRGLTVNKPAVPGVVNNAKKVDELVNNPCSANIADSIKSITNLTIDPPIPPFITNTNDKVNYLADQADMRLQRLGLPTQKDTLLAGLNPAKNGVAEFLAVENPQTQVSKLTGQAKALSDKLKVDTNCEKAKKKQSNPSKEDIIVKNKDIMWGETLLTVGFRAYSLLLGEWYFNLHRMLTGSIRIIGQDRYIEVGTNVAFDIRVLDFSQNLAKYKKTGSVFSSWGAALTQAKEAVTNFVNGEPKYYILAHIEDVNHTFNVSPSGSRVFVTEIKFARGIIAKISDEPAIDDEVKFAVVKNGDDPIYAADYKLGKAEYMHGNLISNLGGNENPYNDNIVFDYNNSREDLQTTMSGFGIENDMGQYDLEAYINNEYSADLGGVDSSFVFNTNQQLLSTPLLSTPKFTAKF